MQVVIVAGGKGTRLEERTLDLPKAMVEIGGKPLLDHQISLAYKYGIKDILILTGFGADYIEKYFGDGASRGLRIRYRRDSQPRGTAGAVLHAFDDLEEVFFVMYGDTMLNVDLGRMRSAHGNSAGATLFLHPNDHPQDSDLVEVDDSRRVRVLHPYPHASGKYFANLVNAGLYIVNKELLHTWYVSRNKLPYPLDFAKHLFPVLISNGAQVCGYISREYIKDIGTPERLDRVNRDYAFERIQRGSLESTVPAVFLDRDGTLNCDRGWINSAEQIELLPGAAEAVRAINESGRLAVVITNQPVIARGECSEAELRRIHNKLEWLLGESHAFVDAIYYCPHHPDQGFPGERKELKFACSCRKPATGLLEQATRELNIDIHRSWMIGDRIEDVQAAKNFGVPCALVKAANQNIETPPGCQPDFRFDNVLEAATFILRQEQART